MNRVIRVTERQQFKRCRRLWDLAFNQALLPVDKSQDARTLGTACHGVLAQYYDTLKLFRQEFEAGLAEEVPYESAIMLARENAWRAYMATFAEAISVEQRELAEGVLNGYFKWCVEKDRPYSIREVEVKLTAQIPGTSVTLQGTMDLIVSGPGGLWVVDHKTYRQFKGAEEAEFDDQLTAYLWLCRQNGYKMAGAIYNVLRKKVPSVPDVLKSGALSRNKSCDTDYTTYLETLVANGLNPDEYQDELTLFRQNEFFRRTEIVRSARALEAFEANLVQEAVDMDSNTLKMYPNFTRECSYCDYKPICRSMNDGGDFQYVIDNMYEKTEEVTMNRRES